MAKLDYLGKYFRSERTQTPTAKLAASMVNIRKSGMSQRVRLLNSASISQGPGNLRRKKTGQRPVFSKRREDYFLAAFIFSQSAFSLASILDASALQAYSIFFLSASLIAPLCEPAIAAEANIIDATNTERTLAMVNSY